MQTQTAKQAATGSAATRRSRTRNPGAPSGAPALLAFYLGRISRRPLLTREEEADLGRRSRRGDEGARSVLVESNLRLVVSVAKEYRAASPGLPFEDLVQEGNVGLMKAVEKFDPDRGLRFSTYATWWIRRAIRKELPRQGRSVGLPAPMAGKVGALNRTRDRLRAQLAREPRDEEAARALGWSVREVRSVLRAGRDATSIDRPAGPPGADSTLGEFVEDEGAAEAFEAVLLGDEARRLREVVEALPERQRRVLVRRYGLDGREPADLAELAEEMGITRQGVSKLQLTTERRLRARSGNEARVPESCDKTSRRSRKKGGR